MSRPTADKLQLIVTAATARSHVPYLRRQLRGAHVLLGSPLRELSLALVGDTTMSALHERFMGIAGPTDVLTFPLECDRHGRMIGGEVVVCVPVARRRAGGAPAALRRELLLYALHGMLHLCGWDDRTDRDYLKMHRKEDDILTRLGVGSVFAAVSRRPQRRSNAEVGA